MNAIVPRATVEEIVRYRDNALALFEQAHWQLEQTHALELEAIDMAKRAFPGTNAYNAAHQIGTRIAMTPVAKLPFDDYMREKRRIIDLNIWAWIIERTDLEHLMDREAKDQLRQQMAHIIEEPAEPGQIITEEEAAKGMPPITIENIYATLEGFMMNSETIFRRGMANAFAKLDRRFRSHDGFKIGSRIILVRCFDERGWWNYGRDERSTLIDIERTFAILDGKLEDLEKKNTDGKGRRIESFTHTIGAIDTARHGRSGARQTEIDTEYFKVRIFKNGNAHLWMTRKDLVQKVNRMIGEYYGEVLADGQTKEDDPLSPDKAKAAPARYYGFYPTPPAAAQEVRHRAELLTEISRPKLRILEPSAGTGNLAKVCEFKFEREWDAERYHAKHLVDCIEIQPHLANELRSMGFHRVFCNDFLQIQPEATGLYDRVIMNPPFDRERDIDHVIHALQFLKPDGLLVAIMSAGTEFRSTAKSVAFRKLMEDMGAEWRDLPPCSFSSVGTNVNTGMIAVRKNGKPKTYGWPTWPVVG